MSKPGALMKPQNNTHAKRRALSLLASNRLRKLLLLLVGLVLSLLLLGALGTPVRSQTELGFKQEALNLRLKPPGFVTSKKCDRSTGELKTLNQRVAAPGVQSAGATVFLSNSGAAPLTDLRFSAKLQSKKVGLSALLYPGFYRFYNPDTEPVDVRVCSTQTSIALDEAKPFDLWIEVEPSFEWDELESWAFSGYLSVSAEQKGVKPATISVSLIDTSPFYKSLFNWILVSAFVLAVFLGVRVYRKKYQRPLNESLKTKIAVNLDLKNSWASKIAAVGGILGTILSASILPEATFLLAKEQYIALNVLFGLLIVFAVAVHNVRQKVWSYLFASVVTVGAAGGQIVTAILLLEEIGIQGTMTPFGVRLLQVSFILAAILVYRAASKRMDPPEQQPSAPARVAVEGTLGGPAAGPPADTGYVPDPPRTTAAL